MIWLCLLAERRARRPRRPVRGRGPDRPADPGSSPGYGFTAIIVAFLGRLHPLGIILAGLLMALSYIGGENAQVEVGLPQAVTGVFQGLLLFFLLASDFLIRYRVRCVAARAGRSPRMNFDATVLVLVTVISAATPLLYAALGELVVEKSGVLNLGVEGMMLVGAVDRLRRHRHHRQRHARHRRRRARRRG